MRSRYPNYLRPVIPSVVTVFWGLNPSYCFIETVYYSPGLDRAKISGTTARYPVNRHLSPGLAMSTVVSLTITSIDLGIPPGGMSDEFSWTLNF